jgi:aminoglycoside 6'-N-acetyltransferase I
MSNKQYSIKRKIFMKIDGNTESIIEAEEKHISPFVEMALDLWPEDNEEILKNVFLKILNADNHKVFLFLIEEKIAAFVYMSIRTDYVEGSDSSPTGYVEGIYVKPGFRKKGIAKRLLTAGEEWVKQKGCKQIGSDAYNTNTDSYNFHVSSGFKVAAELVAFIKNIE